MTPKRYAACKHVVASRRGAFAGPVDDALGELGLRFLERRQPSLEAQVANLSDEIAYNNHDVDDGLRAGLIDIEDLRELAIFRRQYLLVTASGDPAKPSPEDPAGQARAMQYDIALNGWELGGGSVRIHRRDLLERSFALMGHTLEGMHEKFGALLDAFEYGAPPHGGIALGIDRWAARLMEQENIREVMAFPKTGAGSDLMLGSPSPVETSQLAELGLELKAKTSA
jgi:hypothetical protein